MSTAVQMYALILFSFLSWLAFMLTLCKIYKFFSEFENFKSRNDAELNSTVWHLKRAEETRNEILIETRRTNKLLYDIYKEHLQSRGGDEDLEHSDPDLLRLERESINHAKTAHGVPEEPSADEVDTDTRVIATRDVPHDELLKKMQHQVQTD